MEIPFNGISEALRKLIPPLKPGQTATYELLNRSTREIIHPNDTRETIEVIPTSQNVPTRDQIYDPGHEEMVDIGYISKPGLASEKPLFGALWFRKSDGGKIIIRGEDKRMRGAYEYLELTNYNLTSVNPNRSTPTSGAIFKRVQPELSAKEKNEFRVMVRKAQEMVDAATLLELKEMSMAFKLPSVDVSQEEMVLALSNLAETNPKGVLNAAKDEVMAIKSLISEALTAKVLDFLVDEQTWVWGDNRQTITGVAEGQTKEQGLISFIQKNSEGNAFKIKLENQVAKKKPAKK